MSIELMILSKHLFLFVIPFFFFLQSFPASGSFPMSQLYTSGEQSIGASASASVLPVKIQDWFPLGLTGLISSQPMGGFSSLLQHHSSKASILRWSAFFYCPAFTSVHDYRKKAIALIIQTFIGKVMSLLFNMLSRFVIAFLPGSKRLLFSWLQPPFTVTLEPKKIKSVTVSIDFSSICHEMMGLNAMVFVSWIVGEKQISQDGMFRHSHPMFCK